MRDTVQPHPVDRTKAREQVEVLTAGTASGDPHIKEHMTTYAIGTSTRVVRA
jgi:hypothetical protein